MRSRKPYLLSALLFAIIWLLGLAFSGPQPDPLREAYSRPVSEWPAPQLDSGVRYQPMGVLPEVEYPADNPYSRTKAALGKALFFDPILSASNQISCASCHDAQLGWGDGRTVSFGHDRQPGRRNAPTLLNAGHWELFFWDGRAQTLEEQVLFPIQDPLEMNQDLEELVAELSAHDYYPEAFAEAFGSPGLSVERLAKAIATFERSILSRQSRFDRFMEGDYTALNDQEIAGLHLFRTKARCINCHNGPFLTDQQFHNNGQSFYGRPGQDLGLYELSGKREDMGKFRTPSLRDIVYTGPYMHHGHITELEEIVFMYDQGMPQHIPRKFDRDTLPIHSPLLRPLGLTEGEREDLLAFLEAISTRPRSVRPPQMP